MWRSEKFAGDSNTRKAPYSITGQRASVTDSTTWASFTTATQTYLASNGRYSGIGYVFTSDDPFTGIDIDHCVQDKKLNPEAQKLIDRFKSYTELSQSATGIHILVRAKKPGNRSRNGTLELYDQRRFFIITGNHMPDTPLKILERQQEIDKLYNQELGTPINITNHLPATIGIQKADKAIIELASTAKNGDKFKTLYQGGYSAYNNDESRADLAFCSILAFYTRDPVQIDRIFRNSCLMRQKWNRTDYRDRTIHHALQSVTNTYQAKTDNLDTSCNRWEEPISFGAHTAPPFPDIFPDWCDQYAKDFAESVQVPLDAVGMTILAVLSTALARKFVIRPQPNGRWIEKNNLYLLTIMRSGERKTATIKEFASPISCYERDEQERIQPEIIRQKARYEAKEKALHQLKKDFRKARPRNEQKLLEEIENRQLDLETEKILHPPRLQVMDCTTEKLGILMLQNQQRMAMIDAEGDVFSNFIMRYSIAPDRKLLKAGHAGDLHIVDRVSREGGVLTDPTITFGLMVQPSVLASLPKVFTDEGILGRFLFAAPLSKVGYRAITHQCEPQELKEAYGRHMTWLLQLDCWSKELNLDPQANTLFNEFRTRVEIAQRKDGELAGVLEGWASKLAGNVLRTASLIHCAQNAVNREIPRLIEASTIKKAIAFGEYAIVQVQTAFGLIRMRSEMETAKYVLEHIKKLYPKHGQNYSLSYRHLQQIVKTRLTSEELKKAMHTLVTFGYIDELKKKGRKWVFEINPYIFKKQDSSQ
jgi:hypothetical protein